MKLSVKLFLEKEGSFVFGPGSLELITSVKELGSLRKAALRHGISYRWAWGRLNRAEQELGFSLLERTEHPRRGRPMVLTPEAMELIAWFADVQKQVSRVLERKEKDCPFCLPTVPTDGGKNSF